MNISFNRRLARWWILITLFAGLFTLGSTTLGAAESETASQTASEIAAWEALTNGKAIAIMRHAIAPGTGDPAEFELGDCKTQRNLSDEGKLQAQQIGTQIREHGIDNAEVYSSQWCRCVDTATNLDSGSVQQLPMLNSFFQDRSTENAQTEQLKQWIVNRLATTDSATIADQQNTPPAILVTHQVNITALTGVFNRKSSKWIAIINLEQDGSPPEIPQILVPLSVFYDDANCDMPYYQNNSWYPATRPGCSLRHFHLATQLP